MATKKAAPEAANRLRETSRKAALAYVGAFGVVSDEMGKLFERLVDRGEQIEKDMRKRVKSNGKQGRSLAEQVQDRNATTAKASKPAKKATKRVEHAMP